MKKIYLLKRVVVLKSNKALPGIVFWFPSFEFFKANKTTSNILISISGTVIKTCCSHLKQQNNNINEK